MQLDTYNQLARLFDFRSSHAIAHNLTCIAEYELIKVINFLVQLHY